MIHAWHLWNAQREAGRRALANAGKFIHAHLMMHHAKAGLCRDVAMGSFAAPAAKLISEAKRRVAKLPELSSGRQT
jgi:hypothetical protein